MRAAHSPAGAGHGISICAKLDCVTYVVSGAQHATKSVWVGMRCFILHALSLMGVRVKNCATLYLASDQLPQGMLW